MIRQFINRLVFLTAVSLFCVTAVAQTQDDAKTRINALKRNPAYIYGEATLSSPEEAVSASREILLLNLKQYVKENPESLELLPVNLQSLADSAETIQTSRGSMSRFFSFVHKSSFAVYAEQSADTSLSGPERKKTVAQLFEERMSQAGDLFILYNILDSEEWSSLSKYAKVKADTPVTDLVASYLVVFNPDDYSISAILTPKGESGRINLSTRAQDSTRNYPGCQAIWVKIDM